jgi:predicted nucleotidyltransferase
MNFQGKDQKLSAAIEVLKQEFHPKRLFLFGSQAAGTATEDSDYDFVVVVDATDLDRVQNMTKARRLLHEKANISADVFVYPEHEFNQAKDEFSSIPETALNTGMEIPLHE